MKFTYMFTEPPLMEVEYPGDITSFKEYCTHLKIVDTGRRHFMSDSVNVLKEPELHDLNEFLLESLRRYNREILLSNHDVEITSSWTNHQFQGNENPEHHHTNSFLSGTFYIRTTKDSPPIMFKSSFNKYNFSIVPEAPLSGDATSVTRSMYSHPVREGMGVIFSSNQMHGVPPNSVDDERISLAFNTYLKGTTRYFPLSSK